MGAAAHAASRWCKGCCGHDDRRGCTARGPAESAIAGEKQSSVPREPVNIDPFFRPLLPAQVGSTFHHQTLSTILPQLPCLTELPWSRGHPAEVGQHRAPRPVLRLPLVRPGTAGFCGCSLSADCQPACGRVRTAFRLSDLAVKTARQGGRENLEAALADAQCAGGRKTVWFGPQGTSRSMLQLKPGRSFSPYALPAWAQSRSRTPHA